jgi:PEGA domain-containing protein
MKRKKKTALERLLSMVLILSITGCATLFAGSSTVPVVTNPPGAFVYVNGAPVGQTPTAIALEADRPANIQIYLPGFQPVQLWRQKSITGWFWVNILFWPGFFVDLATGKYNKYDDTGIALGLTPAAGPPPEWYQQPQQPEQPYQPMPPPPGGITPGQPAPYPEPPPGR